MAERVELLLAAMTLEEKVGQLGSRWVGNDMQADRPAPDGAERRRSHATSRRCRTSSPPRARVPLEEASRHGLGHLTRVYGSAPVTAAEGAAELVRQQRVVLDVVPAAASRRSSTRSA